MRWKKYTIRVNREYEETVEDILVINGIESYEINDGDVFADAFTGEFYPELQPDAKDDGADDVATISFYGESNEELAELYRIRADIVNALSLSDGDDPVSVEVVDDSEWKDNWKEYFKPFTIEDILITPSWDTEDNEALSLPHRHTVVIDPGLSFGTGGHESTQLVIKELGRLMKGGERVLDVGCGSGILSVIAKKLGAASVSGTDIDPDCIFAVNDNLKKNDVTAGDGIFLTGDIGSDEVLIDKLGRGSFDIVCANILADILISMMPKLPYLMKDGAYLVTSGIIDFKEEDVKKAIEDAGLVIENVTHQGEWVSVTARLPVKADL